MFFSRFAAASLDDVNSSVYQTKQDPPAATDRDDSLSLLTIVSEFFHDITRYTNLSLDDKFIVEIEGLVALLLTIQGCTDYVSIASAIFLYVRKFTEKSIALQVLSYVRDLFALTPQSGVEDAPVEPEWVTLMRNVKDNWSMCKHNKLFSHFSKLLGLTVTLGLCKTSDVTFVLKDYTIFEPDLKVVHGNAADIADAAFTTVTFFVENMYEAFKTRSLKCFLVGDKAALELDEEFATVCLWWDLVKNGNLMKVANVSESTFDDKLERLLTRIRNLLSVKTSFEKKLLSDKITRLLSIKNDYITMKISSGVRKSPFVVQLFGKSSQGKTVFGDQIVDALLMSAGLPIDKEFRASYNPSDKFMSNWSTNKEVMIIDDFANEKANFVEKPPTRVIVDVCNNQPFYANMADLGSKGKVFVEPSLVIVNTNVKDLDSYVYSNCPYSIQRRMNAVITVEAKPEFQIMIDGRPQGLDSEKVRSKYAEMGTVPLFDDIWNLTVERAVEPSCLKTTAGYSPIVFNGKELKNVCFTEVLQYLITMFNAHRANQDFILNTVKNRTKDITLCGVHGCNQIKGYCHLHKFEHQSGVDLIDGVLNTMSDATNLVTARFRRDFDGASQALSGVSTLVLMGAAKRFCKYWDWVTLIPTPWLHNTALQNFLMACDYPKLRNTYVRKTCIMWSSLLVGIGFTKKRTTTQFTCVLGSLATLYCVTRQKRMVELVQDGYRKDLLYRNTISPMLRQYRDENIQRVCKACGIVGTLYAIAKLYKRWRGLRVQGSLEPTTRREVLERDNEDSPWTSVCRRPVPTPEKALCTIPTDLLKIVEKNLVYGTIVTNGRKLQVNCLFLKSNVLIMPSHYFEGPELDCTFRKSNPEQCGGKFATRISQSCSVRLPHTDLCVCYTPNGGSFKDITHWLPLVNLSDHQFSFVWRGIDGELIKAEGLTRSCVTSNGVCDFLGGEYKTFSINTRPGLCGGVVISHGKGSMISGFHLGGMADTPRGCYGVALRHDVDKAISQLRQMEGVIISGDAENFEKQVFGIKVLDEIDTHAKSPLNFMPHESQIEYYGKCGPCVSSHSDAKVTLISPVVTDVMNAPNCYRGPVMKPEWFGWQSCLANMAVPALPFRYSCLSWAVVDYKSGLVPIFASPLWRHTQPLSYSDNICGQKGVKFIDPIKLDTSMGFPLTGPKRNYVIDLPPTEEHPNNRRFVEEVDLEIERCEECYRNGHRAYTIAKACKKDEILSKEKCRIFFSNPIALTFLIRKYYLPLLRVLQMNPLASECAVGINSHGPEWQQFYSHVLTFGEDRILGGDYGKYDQKLPSQLIFAALRILIDLARECDYTEDDIRVMESMAGDIVYAFINFNGDLIGLTEGSHISGNSLTVIINGICGSLNLRAAYYELHVKNELPLLPFRDRVKLMTYGDDNIGSVSTQLDGFNIKYISEFLAEFGQTYTMPDKESELAEFLPLDDFEFLKRSSVFCPERGCHVGALSDKSIFKMLHMYLRPKKCDITEEWASAINIDTALREWFNHGRDVYDKRRQQLKEVAAKCELQHLCTELEVSYEARVIQWLQRYEPWRLESNLD